MKLTKICLLVLGVLLSITTYAQVTTFYSQYMDSPMYNNVGMTASVNRSQLMTQYRNMSLMSGTQVHTSSVTYLKPLYYEYRDNAKLISKRRYGGLSVALTDHSAGRALVYKKNTLSCGLTYNIPIKRNLIFGASIQGGVLFSRIDPTLVTTDKQVIDNRFDPSNPTDENFNGESTTSYLLNMGGSLQSYNKEGKLLYQLGLSFYNIGNSVGVFTEHAYQVPTAMIATGDVLAYSQGSWDIRPNTRILMINDIQTIDAGLNFRYYTAGVRKASQSRGFESSYKEYRNNHWYFSIGLAYRSTVVNEDNKSLRTGVGVLSFSLQKENILIGASFDTPFNHNTGGQLGANNALELLLAYQFRK